MTKLEPGHGNGDPLDAVEGEEPGVANRLRHERPRPSAAFRTELRRRLIALGDSGTDGPTSPVPLIAGYLTGGAVLMVVAAAGIAGIGPFAS